MVETSRDAQRARTAQRILEAARQQFATLGFEAATIRGIAAAAGVDPSLVMQHYGSKAALFGSAVQLPTDDAELATEHLVEVLVKRFGDLPAEMRALVGSMLTVPEAADSMRAYLDERVHNLAGSLEGEDAELRALLTVSGILGFTIARHFLKLSAFDNASPEQIVKAARGWVASVTRA